MKALQPMWRTLKVRDAVFVMPRAFTTIAGLASLGIAVWAAEVRTVWSGPGVTLLGGPSRDGRLLSFADAGTGDLAIRELSSGAVHRLTNNPAGSKEFAYFSAISRDGRHVAYAWFNAEGFYDLRVIDTDGGNGRTLYRNEEAGFVQPCAWSPDGKNILTLFFRSDNISQIALVPAAGGPPKVLRSLNWVYPKRMDLSPDGRFIVYDSFAAADSGDRTIFLLSVDGARETRLVNTPGNHLFPLWSADGRSVVFVSDRSGTMDVWMLDVREGKPDGQAGLLRRDAGRILPLGITANGDYYFGIRSGETDVFVSDLENPVASARRATLRFPGRNSAPAWSPDGKSLAYLSRRGSENFGQESRAIVIRSLELEQERELLPKLAHMERVRWSPGAKAFLVSGSDGKGRAGLFEVNLQSAAVAPLVVEPGADFRGIEGVWSRDGKTLFYIRDGLNALNIETRKDAALHAGGGLRHLAISPDGGSLAVADDGTGIVIVSLQGASKRSIAFKGTTELDWGRDLVAARGAELWRIALDGGTHTKLNAPGNRLPGFSLHPGGKRIALTAGKTEAEVRVMKVSTQ